MAYVRLDPEANFNRNIHCRSRWSLHGRPLPIPKPGTYAGHNYYSRGHISSHNLEIHIQKSGVQQDRVG